MLLVQHLLKYLNINHTAAEAKRLGAGVTDMGGWSDALNAYQIANIAVRLQPQQLSQATFPCIAHCLTPSSLPYFMAIEGISEGQLSYHDGQKVNKMALAEFIKIWSGAVLLLSPDEHGGEPNYEANKRTERFENIQRAGIVVAKRC